MKKIVRHLIIIAGISACLFGATSGQAQSVLGSNSSYSLGIVRYVWKLKEPKLRMLRNPLIAFRKGAAVPLGGPWQVCGDVVLYKNTNKIRRQTGRVMESYHLTLPVTINYQLGKQFFAEAGMYIGAMAYPENIAQSELIRLSHIEDIQVHMDGGFLASAGVNLSAKKVLKFTYNYGLLRVLPDGVSSADEKLSENRYFELSLYVRL